jgi:hypothetical protein
MGLAGWRPEVIGLLGAGGKWLVSTLPSEVSLCCSGVVWDGGGGVGRLRFGVAGGH